MGFLTLFSLVLLSTLPKVTYIYTLYERHANRTYQLSVREDGRVEFSAAVENSEPERHQLPRDTVLASTVFAALRNGAGRFCGAPRNGTLIVTKSDGSVEKHDLTDIRELHRYGSVIELMERRLHPDVPVISRECVPLLPPSRPEVLSAPGTYEKVAPEHPARSPKPFFLRFIASQDEDARVAALYEVVSTKGSDPFFAYHLVSSYPYSQEAADVAMYYPAPMVYWVTDEEQARNLLKSLKKIKSRELRFYRALLYLRLYAFGPAASEMRKFFSWIGLPSVGERWKKRILSAQKLTGEINKGAVSWAQQVLAVAALYSFWRDVAELISPPDASMPPLAWEFHERAFHYARMFAGNPQVGRVPQTGEARAYLRTIFPLVAARPWWALPYSVQYDLLTLMGVMRAWPRPFGGRKEVEKLIPDLTYRVRMLVLSHRVSTALKLIEKNGRDPNLYATAGWELARFGRWKDASRLMALAREGGADKLTRRIAEVLIESGRLDPLSEELEEDDTIGYAYHLLDEGRATEALAILSRVPEEARDPELSFQLLRAQLAASVRGSSGRLAQMAKKSERARFLLADALVASRAPFATVYDLLIPSLYGSRGPEAWTLLSISSGSPMFLQKAIHEGWRNPESLIGALELLARHGAHPAAALNLGLRLHAVLPYSARIAYALALIYLRFGAIESSLAYIDRALAQRPTHRPYLELKRAILAQRTSSR